MQNNHAHNYFKSVTLLHNGAKIKKLQWNTLYAQQTCTEFYYSLSYGKIKHATCLPMNAHVLWSCCMLIYGLVIVTVIWSAFIYSRPCWCNSPRICLLEVIRRSNVANTDPKSVYYKFTIKLAFIIYPYIVNERTCVVIITV